MQVLVVMAGFRSVRAPLMEAVSCAGRLCRQGSCFIVELSVGAPGLLQEHSHNHTWRILECNLGSRYLLLPRAIWAHPCSVGAPSL